MLLLLLGLIVLNHDGLHDQHSSNGLRKSHNVTLRVNRKANTTGDGKVGITKGAQKVATLGMEYVEMKLVVVRVDHQQLARVGDVDAIGEEEEGDAAVLADCANKLASFVENTNGVSFEVTDEILFVVDGDVARFFHIGVDGKGKLLLARLGQDPDKVFKRIDEHNHAILCGGESCDDSDAESGNW